MPTSTHTTARAWPGDPKPSELAEQALRVNHAGECAARSIYAGQRAVMQELQHPCDQHLALMEQEELRHLKAFENLLAQRRVRPSALLPLWHIASHALGGATALMGEKSAMACTVAVEELIVQHYDAQSKRLRDSDPELCKTLDEFSADEQKHLDQAADAGGRNAPGFSLMRAAIQSGCRVAIWLSERA